MLYELKKNRRRQSPVLLSESTFRLLFPDNDVEMIISSTDRTEMESKLVDECAETHVCTFQCRLRIPISEMMSSALEIWQAGNDCQICLGDRHVSIERITQKERLVEFVFLFHVEAEERRTA